MNPDEKLVMYCFTLLILIAPFAFWVGLYLAISVKHSLAMEAVLLIQALLWSGRISALVLVVLYFAGILRLDAWPLAAALAVSSAILLLPRAWLRARISAESQPVLELRTASAGGETTGPALPDKIRPAIIRTPRLALVILIVAACDAASRLWHLTFAPQPRADWIYPLHWFLPNWAAVAMNVLTYGGFAAMLVEILRELRGAERTLLAICLAEVLIAPVKRYAPSVVTTAIVWAQAFGALIMFLAAVQLFMTIRELAGESPEPAARE